MGGFGGGSWGGGAFGGSNAGGPAPVNVSETVTIAEGLTAERAPGPVAANETVSFTEGLTAERAPGPVTVSETVTITEGLTVSNPLSLVSATAENAYLVLASFSHDLDLGYAPNLSVFNYGITPSLDVVAITPGPASNQVYIVTSEQTAVTYTLTVDDGRSISGDILAPPNQTETFPGFPLAPRFTAAAQGIRKVMLTFSAPMNTGAPFTNVSNYTIVTTHGVSIPVVAATAQGAAPVTRVTLTLGADLVRGGYYVATVNSAVQTVGGNSIVFPRTDVFQWASMELGGTRAISIPISAFSGEVTSGLLGEPDGLVFFSPALEVSAANSVLEIDQVTTCTQAYDTYQFPELEDPPALFTNTAGSVLGGATILWAPAERLGLAKMSVSDLRLETMPAVDDGPADSTLVETIDITRAAFLNDSRWVLNTSGGGTTRFTCADNLTPIGAGPTTTRNLQP